ncbi:hypothetical protein BTVI_39994 [Pitangus sulphuratus]|nr:hypothetical protein BTVI_39994 [Pitangus sulphuratus]
MQVVKELTRNSVILNFILRDKEGLVEDVKVGDSLDYSDQEIVEFNILYGGSRVASKITSSTSGELTFASSGIFLEKFHGNNTCREKGSKDQ